MGTGRISGDLSRDSLGIGKYLTCVLNFRDQPTIAIIAGKPGKATLSGPGQISADFGSDGLDSANFDPANI
jgi:hypothetical protein